MAKEKKPSVLALSKIPEDPDTAGPDRYLCRKCNLDQWCETPYSRPPVTKGWTGKVVAVGEAPGAEEDREGKYFVGRSGKLLRSEFDRAGYPARDVTFLNAVRCRPANNATPSMEQIRCCRPFLLHELQRLKPQVVLALGVTAAKSLLNSGDASVVKSRGRPLEVEELK